MVKKGFTLVELSIVLVIIGLLIGGILAARSMITTTKTQNSIRQLQQFDVALTNFRTRYKQLPGDSNLLPNPGDNNGLIDNSLQSEYAYVWPHLSAGVGLKSRNNNDYIALAGNFKLADRCPSLPIQKEDSTQLGLCLIMIYESVAGADFRNFYRNAGSTVTFLASDALAIDVKIDDGLPDTGKTLNQNAYAPNCAASGKYDVSKTTFECNMYFEIGSTAPSSIN